VDSITHIALGAIVGEALAGKKLGKRAMIFGAAAQSLPDIDFLAALWLNPYENLLAHRGFTHSFLFVILITPILALLLFRWKRSISLPHWIYFFTIQMSIHVIIDSFNAYGVGWLEPFSHDRFSYHLLFVADPFFSIPLGLTGVALIILKTDSIYRLNCVRLGLIAGTLYLGYTVYNKLAIEQDVRAAYSQMNIEPSKHFTTPTPFNNWLWYAVAEVDSGYYVSYHSVFDTTPDTTVTFIYRNEEELNSILDQGETQLLLRFSQGYYTVEHWNDTLIFNDLRFGQIAGWENPQAKFVFHYFLQHPDENKLVVQRGRFANWNKQATRSFVKRIKGN
jgi:inner membrane protein